MVEDLLAGWKEEGRLRAIEKSDQAVSFVVALILVQRTEVMDTEVFQEPTKFSAPKSIYSVPLACETISN